MPIPQTLQSLTRDPAQPPPEDPQTQTRREARCAWAKQRIKDYKAAVHRAESAWRRLTDEDPDAPDEDWYEDESQPPEQDEADLIWIELIAVCDHDRWPRHLYWSG